MCRSIKTLRRKDEKPTDQEIHNAAPRTHGRGTDEHGAVRVLDHLDEAIVAGPVDPAARGDRCFLDPGAHIESLLFRLLFGEAGRAQLRIGERDPWLRAVIGARPWFTEDVVDGDAGVVDRHMSEAPAGCHVADCPEPLAHAGLVSRFEETRRWIGAHRLPPDV